jgi:hypothetical protein
VAIIGVGAVPAAASAQPPAGRAALEQRVDRALAFLKDMQEDDGGWRVARAEEHNPAITSLAVMAFLSAGHVPGEGPYGDVVTKGVRHVLAAQLPNGLIATAGGHELYHHGICTLMLAEVAGMTDAALGKEVRAALRKAVPVLLEAQRTEGTHAGGWRYRVSGNDADLSVTGWQLLALRAAHNLGCDVPAERIDLAVKYVKNCRDPHTHGFCYQPGGRHTLACTGTGILALEICGKDQHLSLEARQAGTLLLKETPAWTDGHFFYAIYYCSQGMFQLGNNYWGHFRPRLHKVLFAEQLPNGSWIGNDGYGPNYGTAMAVLALTVEYRLLPIYQRKEP